MALPPRAGVVLAGGYSTRFGEDDKALATVDGDTMLARVIRRLGEVVDTVVVNCRSDQQSAFADVLADCEDCPPVSFALDDTPDKGPLAGISYSFEGIEAEYTAVVACDMPAVDPDLLCYLFERATGRDGAVPKLPDGHLQPTQAVYRTEAMRAETDRQLAAGKRSLQSAIDRLDVVLVAPEEISQRTDLRTLRDANTRSELDTFEGE